MYSASIRSTTASACDDSSAGMIPSERARAAGTRRAPRHRCRGGTRRGRCRGGTRARGRRPGSRARPRSSARRRSGRRSSARIDEREPCSTPVRPPPSDAAPAASTPISRTSASSMKPANIPIAFEPPPTQATTASGQRALRLEQLLARLAADHRLQLAHDLGIRRRPDARADHVVGRLDVRDPVADRLARRLLQRLRAELDGHDGGAHQVHALDVRSLAPHVLGAHEDDALEPEARARGRRRDAVLARRRSRR